MVLISKNKTPLTAAPGLSDEEITVLRSCGIHTWEEYVAYALTYSGVEFGGREMFRSKVGDAVYEGIANAKLKERPMGYVIPPASLTKIMTGLLAVEAVERGEIAMDTRIVAPSDCWTGLDSDSSNAEISPGEEMDFGDYLYCAMVKSANEACNVVAEHIEVELGLGRKGILHIAVKVHSNQTAAVVGTQRYLAARVGAHRAVAEVGITVGHAFTQDGVPEQHTRLGRGPSVVDNLVPQGAGINLFTYYWVGGVYGVLLHERLAVAHAFHKLVSNLHRHVGASNLALL